MRLIPDGPAMNCGQLAVGDIIESVDGMPLASLSLDEIGDGLKGQPGSIITLYIHARGAHAETKRTREKKSNSETSLSVGLSQGSLVLSVQDPDNKGVVEEITVSMDQVYYKVRWNNGKLSDWLLAMEIARDTAQLADALVSMNSAERRAFRCHQARRHNCRRSGCRHGMLPAGEDAGDFPQSS